MRSITNMVLHFIGLVGAVVFVGAITLGLSYVGPRTEAVAATTTPGMVNPYATLDASQIDDLRGQGYTVSTPSGDLLLVPDGAVLETTPMVPVPDTAYVVPEESPEGGYVRPYGEWLDNSPLYSDGWLLFVDDAQHVVKWRAPESVAQESDRYGAGGGAVCGTDAQCRTWDHDHGVTAHDLPCDPRDPHDRRKCSAAIAARVVHVAQVAPTTVPHGQVPATGYIIAEDGSMVPSSYYDHVTTTGATQARCDYLGKRRVPDATYGHRCV